MSSPMKSDHVTMEIEVMGEVQVEADLREKYKEKQTMKGQII